MMKKGHCEIHGNTKIIGVFDRSYICVTNSDMIDINFVKLLFWHNQHKSVLSSLHLR